MENSRSKITTLLLTKKLVIIVPTINFHQIRQSSFTPCVQQNFSIFLIQVIGSKTNNTQDITQSVLKLFTLQTTIMDVLIDWRFTARLYKISQFVPIDVLHHTVL